MIPLKDVTASLQVPHGAVAIPITWTLHRALDIAYFYVFTFVTF
jgi:hypothetical protein